MAVSERAASGVFFPAAAVVSFPDAADAGGGCCDAGAVVLAGVLLVAGAVLAVLAEGVEDVVAAGALPALCVEAPELPVEEEAPLEAEGAALPALPPFSVAEAAEEPGAVPCSERPEMGGSMAGSPAFREACAEEREASAALVAAEPLPCPPAAEEPPAEASEGVCVEVRAGAAVSPAFKEDAPGEDPCCCVRPATPSGTLCTWKNTIRPMAQSTTKRISKVICLFMVNRLSLSLPCVPKAAPAAL